MNQFTEQLKARYEQNPRAFKKYDWGDEEFAWGE